MLLISKFFLHFSGAFHSQSQGEGSRTNGLVIGLCVPKSCSKEQLAMIVNELHLKANYSEKNFDCSTERQPFSAGPIVTTIILTLLLLLVFVGTVIDLLLTYKTGIVSKVRMYGYHNNQSFKSTTTSPVTETSDQSCASLTTQTLINETTPLTFQPASVPFLAEFSFVRILQKIFTVPKSDDQTDFAFLNGMRVLSLFLVILAHSLLFGLSFTNNVLDVLSWTQNFAFMVVLNASFSVDTFFVLSGFVTAILFTKQVEKNRSNGKPILSAHLFLMYYIHRYLRLTPTFMLVLLVSVNLTAYFGRGPLFPSMHGFESEDCSKYWWTSLLYINNLVKPQEMCLGVTWYLANDMQFHWIAPLALIPFVLKRRRISFLVISLFILTSIICTAVILIANPKMGTSISNLSVSHFVIYFPYGEESKSISIISCY